MTQELTKDDLRGCPFCAGEGEIEEIESGSFGVGCPDCDFQLMTGPIGLGWHKSVSDAVGAWNERHADLCIEQLQNWTKNLQAQLEAANKKISELEQGKCLHQIAEPAEQSATYGMHFGDRVLHIGGRENAAGYIEFGSVEAVRVLVGQVLRDLPGGAPGFELAATHPTQQGLDALHRVKSLVCLAINQPTFTSMKTALRVANKELDAALAAQAKQAEALQAARNGGCGCCGNACADRINGCRFVHESPSAADMAAAQAKQEGV